MGIIRHPDPYTSIPQGSKKGLVGIPVWGFLGIPKNRDLNIPSGLIVDRAIFKGSAKCPATAPQ